MKNFYPHARKGLPSVVLLLGVWFLAIRQLALEWTINPEYQYGWVVPVLALLLAWRLWPQRPIPDRASAGAAMPLLIIFLVILAVPLRIIEEANPEWRLLNYYFMGQAILVTVLVLDYSGGRSWMRHFSFPLLFPLIAVPWPSGLEHEVIQGLQTHIAAIGVEGISWMGWSAYERGNLIILPQGIIGVNEACSGIRSLQSSLMIGLFLGEYFHVGVLRRCLLLALALFLALILNILRAFFLIIVLGLNGTNAESQIHDPAGFGIALGTLLLLWLAALKLAGREVRLSPAGAGPTGFLRVPAYGFIILLTAWLSAEILNQGWYQWRERQFLSTPGWTLQWPLPFPGFKEEKIDEVVRTYLRYDEGWHGRWNDQSHWDLFFFIWKPSRVAAGLAQSHRPDICLPAAGYLLKETRPLEKMDVKGLVLPIQPYIFQDSYNGNLLFVFQMITDDKTRRGQTDIQTQIPDRRQRLEAAWDGRRNPGQRSLFIVNQGAPGMNEAEDKVHHLLESYLVISPATNSIH